MISSYTLTVNGADHEIQGAWPGESLLHVLRERLGLVSAKAGCEQGECGSCSVLVDGALVCACLVLAAAAPGSQVVTLEGLQPDRHSELTTVQAALLEAGGVQCGFCTPGLVMAIHDLLERDEQPGPLATREALAGNLCRCTGYGRVLAAVGAAMRQAAPLAAGP